MKHILETFIIDANDEIMIEELDLEMIRLTINQNGVDGLINSSMTYIKKEDLHSFIGILLHIQSKMKGGKR